MKSRDNISIVLPVYNESDALAYTIKAIEEIISKENVRYEIILVDDGSTDNSWEVIHNIAEGRGGIRAISFSRNFGKEAALLAGLAYASGQAVITMDSDLQHPPEIIPQFLKAWKDGYKIVEGIKSKRGVETIGYHLFAHIFYQLISRAVGSNLANTSDFKLLDREVINVILKMPEKQMFYRAITSWIGFRSIAIKYEVKKRQHGKSKWSTTQLILYAVRNITSFTSAPLQIIMICSLLFLFLGVWQGVLAFTKWAAGSAVEGFTTVILLQFISGSIIMFALGLIGYYIAKLNDEIRNRPRYIVEEKIGLDEKE